jgi:hypothetical protein
VWCAPGASRNRHHHHTVRQACPKAGRRDGSGVLLCASLQVIKHDHVVMNYSRVYAYTLRGCVCMNLHLFLGVVCVHDSPWALLVVFAWVWIYTLLLRLCMCMCVQLLTAPCAYTLDPLCVC